MIKRRLRRAFQSFRRGSTGPPTPSGDNVPSLLPSSSLAKDYRRSKQNFNPRFGGHNRITSSSTGLYDRAESGPVNVPRSLPGALDQNTGLAQSLYTGHPVLRPRDPTITPRSTAAYVSGAPRSSLASTVVSSHNEGTSVSSDSLQFMNIAPQLSHPFRAPYPDAGRFGEVPTSGWFTGPFYDEGDSVSSGSSYTSIFDSLEDHMVDCHWGHQADSRAYQRDNVESALSGPPLISWFSFNDDSMESLSDTELVLAESDRSDAKFGSVDHPHSHPVVLELEEEDGQTDNKVSEACSMDATLLGNIVTRQVTPLSGPTLPTGSTLALTGSIYTAASSSVEPIKQPTHSLVPEPPGLPALPFSPPSLSSLGSRDSDLVRDGLEAQLGDSNWGQVDSSYDWGPQLPPALDDMTHLVTLVARDPSSGTASTLNLQPNMPAPKHHVNSFHPLDGARPPLSGFPAEFIQPDLGSYAVDTASFKTARHEHVAKGGSNVSHIHCGNLVDRPTASNRSSSTAEACDKGHEPVGDCTISLTCTSCEDIFQIEPPGQGDGQLHTSSLPSEEVLVTTTTEAWVYAASKSDNGATRALGRQSPGQHHEITAFSTHGRGNNDGSTAPHPLYSACGFGLGSMNPKAVFKESDIFHASHLTGIGANRGICALPSSDIPSPKLPPWAKPFTSQGRVLWTLSAGVGIPWIMRLTMKHGQYVITAPMLPSAPFPMRWRHRKFRVDQCLQAISPYAFSWDPGASGSAFNFGYTPGSNQTPGNTYPRIEDGSGIWSGQGPGSNLNVVSSQWPESLELAGRFEDIFQPLGDSILNSLHDSNGGVATRSLHSSPSPPVPLRLDILRELLFEVFSAGVDAGLSLGNRRTSQWETGSNVFGLQHPNRLGEVQERAISTLHHPPHNCPSSLGFSHGGDNWIPGLPLADLNALVYEESRLSEPQLPPGPQGHPTPAPSDTENTQDPVGGVISGVWTEPPTPHIGADKIIGLQGSNAILLGNDCSSNDSTDPATECGQSIDPSHSVLPASQTHPARIVTASKIGSEPPHLGGRPEQRGNEYKHQCNQCGQRFRRWYLLCDHIRAHENEKPYLCTEGCGRKYANRSGMMRHLKQMHLDTANSEDVPSPSNEQTRAIRGQIPQAGPSTFRGNTRFSHAFVPYDPSSARHKSRQRKQ